MKEKYLYSKVKQSIRTSQITVRWSFQQLKTFYRNWFSIFPVFIPQQLFLISIWNEWSTVTGNWHFIYPSTRASIRLPVEVERTDSFFSIWKVCWALWTLGKAKISWKIDKNFLFCENPQSEGPLLGFIGFHFVHKGVSKIHSSSIKQLTTHHRNAKRRVLFALSFAMKLKSWNYNLPLIPGFPQNLLIEYFLNYILFSTVLYFSKTSA